MVVADLRKERVLVFEVSPTKYESVGLRAQGLFDKFTVGEN
jgi:hypothetical protein